ncbi:flavodoxin family protein [Gordonia soli]|uniref:Flavodoxin-like domain-containing protein n=1 Tax=Gordonia soli NBRC 108243 TaxID=1223545 RepID=M0QMG3_9ACTN|nr:flavodoxin family protein [Gordonia soli]GAC69609.1 hypothetical protein GS4_26_00570 [Gordonia soli NBRC 108243]
MKSIIVTTSRSPHGNTRRIADAIGRSLDAEIVTPTQTSSSYLDDAELVGFGSGIYYMGFDRRLVEFIAALPEKQGRRAFVFATSGLPEPPFRRYTRTIGRALEHKGFEVVDTFVCRGLDTWGPFGAVGGVNKGHPAADDLTEAREFGRRLAGG